MCIYPMQCKIRTLEKKKEKKNFPRLDEGGFSEEGAIYGLLFFANLELELQLRVVLRHD